MFTYIYIYIYRKRERERERKKEGDKGREKYIKKDLQFKDRVFELNSITFSAETF